MNKNKKLLLIILITIIVGIIGFIQVMPIVVEKPNKDFSPININQANNSQDNNMTLSFLYNITKEKHPIGTQENYRVKTYIEDVLKELNVNYNVSEHKLNEEIFNKILKRNKEKIKNSFYSDFKNEIGSEDVEKRIKEETGYDTFDEFYNEVILKENNYELELEERCKKEIQKYKNEILNNIIVKMKSKADNNTNNILFVAHYDSTEQSYGAGDNGMNVAGLLETIRILKDKQFNNNIYILFTDGEESSYLGAYSFIENNNIKFDLVINFDNAGSSGNMMLYHYSNDFLTKQYFKSVNNESSYSFINDLLYNPNSRFYQGSTSDAFAFIENGYNTIDIALSCNAQNYHGEEDNFYNIDVNALSETTKNMIDMFSYYGDNGEINTNDEKLINFQLFKGFEISLKQKTYIIISMLIIAINYIYSNVI